MVARILLAAVLCSACSGNSPAGPSPTPVPTPTPSTVTLTGTIMASGENRPLAASLQIGAQTTIADGTGHYVLTLPLASGSLQATIQGSVAHVTQVNAASSRTVNLEAFGSSFDLNYFRRIARNGQEAPNSLQPLRHLSAAPRIYLRTIDENGTPIDAASLDVAERTLLATGWPVSAVSVERGTASGATGTITVRWDTSLGALICGNSLVGLDAGTIRLNPAAGGTCGCNGATIRPRTVRHEFGHALGFWHTHDGTDLMSGDAAAACDQLPTAREIQYLGFLTSRPVGNVDPDTDPVGVVNLAPMRVSR